MTSDLDIYRSANELIKQHGDAADIEAAMRADGRLAAGDKRYRTGGEQTVRVEHVTVNEGGRAIVGTVNQGGRGTSETRGQGHAKAITHAPGTTLRSADPKADPVPVAGGERPEAVPHARRR